ncbi:hypothetical protein BD769DRAFT_1391141 [Suillus cothurnatus]|nr:hypothetical protein BD769DRAFT_1391141 [Suillus cothurnatus]
MVGGGGYLVTCCFVRAIAWVTHGYFMLYPHPYLCKTIPVLLGMGTGHPVFINDWKPQSSTILNGCTLSDTHHTIFGLALGFHMLSVNRVEEGVTWANPIFLSYQVQLQPSSPAWLLVSLPSRPTWIIVLPACKALSSSLLMTEARHDVAEVGVTIERPAVVLPWSGSKLWFEPDQWSGFSNAHGGDWLFDLSSNKKSNPHQDAKDIVFYNDPDDTIPLCAQSSSESAQPPLCTTSAKSAPHRCLLSVTEGWMQTGTTDWMLVNLKASTPFGVVSPHYTLIFVVVPTGEAQCLSRQSTLDSNLIPKLPIFSKAGLLKYIWSLSSLKMRPLQLVDKQHSTGCSPMSALPLLKVDSQVSMTFDSWTSMIGDPFFSITGHYIWSLDDKPQQWELCYKVGWMTSDNATNNDTAMKEVGHQINPNVLPTPQAALMRKIRQAVDDGNDAELNTLTQELASMEVDNDDHDGTSFDAGDSLGKALTLIEQSPQARAFFQKACQEENVPQLELFAVGQNSLGFVIQMSGSHVILCCAVNHFTNLVDKSKELPTLTTSLMMTLSLMG